METSWSFCDVKLVLMFMLMFKSDSSELTTKTKHYLNVS